MALSNSWRLDVREIDKSSTVRLSVNTTGAMVIRASKGPTKPVFINPNKEQRIINLLGKPSVSYPDVQEVIEYNKEAPVWVSAPYAVSDTYGGVLVSSTGTAPLESGLTDSDIESYTFSESSQYFVLLSRSPYKTDDLAVLVTQTILRENEANELKAFEIELYQKDKGLWDLKKEYTVCLDSEGVDGFGRGIYIEDVLENDDFLKVIVNENYDTTLTFNDDSEKVEFAGGSRTDPTIEELTDGWDYFKKPRQYEANIFMDCTADDGIPSIFNNLRNNYQKYAHYIIKLPMSENVSTAISTKQDYGIDNRGLSFSWNHGKVKNFYGGSSFWTSLIGRVGRKYAQMAPIFNGGAPAWIDENGYGGQLGPGIEEMEFDPTETELEQLDENGINPIILDPGVGALIVSQRTAQSPTKLSDTSWIAHSRLFDFILKNIIEQVLVQQIVKLNDTQHRQMAKSKGNTIMASIAAENLISDYAIICDETNNTDEMLAQRYFVYDVILKVTPYSEQIRFNFVNIGQTVEVSEFVG